MHILSVLGIFWNLGLLLQSLLALFLFHKIRKRPDENFSNKIHILIPVRSEKPTHLNECLEYFLAKRNIDKLTICLTQIENDYRKYLPLLESRMKEDNRLSYVTYNGLKGYKAEQLNVALNQILFSKEKVIVGFYDIDSRPDFRVFEFIKKNYVDIGQQPTIYNANLRDLNFLALAGAVHQTLWSVSFELFNFLFPKARLVYAVGHGLFISSDTLHYCGAFDEKSVAEDLMYGYKCSIAKRKFSVIPYFEHTSFVRSFSSFIIQSARWYAGELELVDRFQDLYSNFNGILTDKKNYYFRLIELAWWPFERLLYIVTIIFTFVGLIDIELTIFYTLILVLSGYVPVFIIAKNSNWNAKLLIAPIMIPVWHSISVLGPIVAIIKKFLRTPIEWTVTQKI